MQQEQKKPKFSNDALCFVQRLLIALVVLFAPCRKLLAQDSASYWNKAWRDSVSDYRGRVEAYHQELYSYDWGMTFGMLPVAGEAYVGKMGTGIEYSAARAVVVAAGVVGVVRLIEGKPNFGLNLGLIAAGIFGYGGLKFSELADIRHTVSERDESLVEQYRIEIPDIEPHSIRYPEKQWPDWVTSWPPVPPKVNPREAVDKPLPKERNRDATGNE